MHLYSDKVMITDKRELLPLAKCDTFVVASNKSYDVIYSNVPKEVLKESISKKMITDPRMTLLQLAIDITDEIKTIPGLKIIDDKVSVENAEKAKVLMTNTAACLIIAECCGKIYTNNVEIANLCMQYDLNSRDPQAIASAELLKMLIDMRGGLVECELKVMREV